MIALMSTGAIMKSFLLLILCCSLPAIAQANNCLKVESFNDLAAFTSFEFSGWQAENKICTPKELRALDALRIQSALGISGVEFIKLGFDGQSCLSWESFTVDGSDKAYDLYLYEAGDNGSGFIFEKEKSSHPVAFISDGNGGEVLGCIEF